MSTGARKIAVRRPPEHVLKHALSDVRMERRRRPDAVQICHSIHGVAVINDQRPMTEAALTKCLDDGLAPANWLAILNRRVFFWSDEKRLQSLLGTRANRARALDVVVVETLPLAVAYAKQIELSPINTGATPRRPARRGPATFTPLLELSYRDWSGKRGRRDAIREVTVVDGIPDIRRYVREIRRIDPVASAG